MKSKYRMNNFEVYRERSPRYVALAHPAEILRPGRRGVAKNGGDVTRFPLDRLPRAIRRPRRLPSIRCRTFELNRATVVAYGRE